MERADAVTRHLNAQDPISTVVVARSIFSYFFFLSKIKKGGGQGAVLCEVMQAVRCCRTRSLRAETKFYDGVDLISSRR